MRLPHCKKVLAAALSSTCLFGCGGSDSPTNEGAETLVPEGSITSGPGRAGSSLPDVSIKSVFAPTTISADSEIGITVEIENTTGEDNAEWGTSLAFYLSEDDVIDPLTDIPLDAVILLDTVAGEVLTDYSQVEIPAFIGTGEYYIGAVVDYKHYLAQYLGVWLATFSSEDPIAYAMAESNEDNNTMAFGPVTINGSGTCADDEYEPDNTTPREAQLGVTEFHNFCFDTSDKFYLDANAGQSYEVTLSDNSGESGGFYLALKDGSGSIIETRTPNFGATINWTAPTSQRYVIEVLNDDISWGNYGYYDDPKVGVGSDYSILIQ